MYKIIIIIPLFTVCVVVFGHSWYGTVGPYYSYMYVARSESGIPDPLQYSTVPGNLVLTYLVHLLRLQYTRHTVTYSMVSTVREDVKIVYSMGTVQYQVPGTVAIIPRGQPRRH